MKRVVMIMMVIAVLFSGMANAEGPSKTLGDVSRIVFYLGVDNADEAQEETDISFDVELDEVYTHEELLKSEFFFSIIEDSDITSAEVMKVHAAISTPDNDVEVPADYFPIDVQEKAQQMLPETVEMKNMVMNEAVTLRCEGYLESYGVILANFEFITMYDAGQSCVALVGISDGIPDENGEYAFEWVALECDVSAEGTINILFQPETMMDLEEAQEIVLVLFSTEAQ